MPKSTHDDLMAWIYIATICFLCFISGEELNCSHERKVYRNKTSETISNVAHKYKPDQRCEWLLVNPNPEKFPYITLKFNEVETECSFDYVMVFNGASYNDELLATFSGFSTESSLPQLSALSRNMLIYFSSDHSYNIKGFSATFHVYACPNNCSGHGTCIQNKCHCPQVWSGIDCSKRICPNSCTNSHGSCDLSIKRCICFDAFLGIGCRMRKRGHDLDHTWMLVYNYTDKDERLTTGLAGHAAAYIGNYLWIFGGYNLNAIFSNLFKYNFSANDWELVRSQTQPSGRYYHTMTHITEERYDCLFVFGGNIGNDRFSDELWIYDISLSSWSLVTNNLKGTLYPVAQHAAALVALNREQYLYIFGGQTSNDHEMGLSSDMFRFNLKTYVWEQVHADPSGFVSVTLKKTGHTMVFDKTANVLVVFGGYSYLHNASAERSNQVLMFDLNRNFWIEIKAANSPKPMAFHTANIVGDHMVVFGGSVHTHFEDESCHSDELHFYNLRCNTWETKEYFSNEKPPGLHSHVAATGEDHLLFIHGGYNGMVSNQMFVYRVPLFAIDNSSLSMNRICNEDVSSLYDKANCLKDKRCVWCKQGFCMGLNDDAFCPSQSMFESPVVHPSCPGFCHSLSSCKSCTSLNSYTLNLNNEWESTKCQWCASDIACHSLGHIPEHSECSRNMADDREVWWDSPDSLTNTTLQCIERDIPPGLQAAFYYNDPKLTSPDDVIFVKDQFSLRRKLVNLPAGNHSVVIKGYLYIFDSTVFSGSNPKLRLDSIKGLGKLYLSTNDRESSSHLVLEDFKLLTELSVSHINVATVNRTIGANQRLFYKVSTSFSPDNLGHWLGTITLMWKVRSSNSRRGFYPIKSNFLEPYSSHADENKCPTYADCMACLLDYSCAWCSGTSRCVPRILIIQSQGSLCTTPTFSQSLRYAENQRYFGVVLDVSSCPACEDLVTCQSCVSDSSCQWNHTDISRFRGCKRKGYFSEGSGISTAVKCPVPCLERSTCNDCLRGENNVCRWCRNTQRCYNYRYHRVIHSMGQCRDWIQDQDHCLSCNVHTSCRDCLQNFHCGWFGSNSSRFQGACLQGDFRDVDGAASPVNTTNSNSYYEWFYESCRIDECSMEWPVGVALHNCSPNATCMDTPNSYSCSCNRGFLGDGVECTPTCPKDCGAHGDCSGAPDYHCKCHLGWTGDGSLDMDCHLDCLCNLHSSCVTGIGICDRCTHNTQGEHCDECVPNFFGDPKSRNGCVPCECNGHGNPIQDLCHSLSGDCSCLNNTQGNRCDECLPGYYGDPRNGGACYSKCLQRTFFTQDVLHGAFGTYNLFDEPADSSIKFCEWVISAAPDNIIELLIDKRMQVNCSVNRILVKDELSAKATLLGSFCGQSLSEDILLFSHSGFLSVFYEKDVLSSEPGFNATFRVLPCNSTCPRYISSFEELCPNNCSSKQGHGLCIKGVCHCNADYVDRDCSIPSFGLRLPVYRQVEWSSKLSKLATVEQGGINADAPGVLSGHSLVSDGPFLWLFGGFSYEKLSSDLWRYDTVKKNWLKVSTLKTQKSPPARHLHSAVSAPSSNAMLLYGGLSANGSTLNDFWEFDFEIENYTLVDGWKEIGSNLSLPAVAGHTMTFCLQHFLLIGGYYSERSFNKKVLSFNSLTRQWKRLSNHGAKFPGVYGHTSSCDPVSGSIYVFGGLKFSPTHVRGVEPSNSIYTYNVLHERWSILKHVVFHGLSRPPPSLYFHTVLPYEQDSGFLLFGGKSGDGALSTVTWLFRYDCRILVEMVGQESNSEKHVKAQLLEPFLAVGSAAAVVSDANLNLSPTFYVYGGDRNGVLLDILQTIHVTSPCYSASTDCDCRLLKAGCTLCENELDTMPSCLPATTSLSECNIFRNDASSSEHGSITSSCSSCNLLSSEDLTCSHLLESENACGRQCSEMRTCEDCVSLFPSNSQKYCKWCPNNCLPTFANHTATGTCVAVSESCYGTEACGVTECKTCAESDCASCEESEQSCTWSLPPFPFDDEASYKCTRKNDLWTGESLSSGNTFANNFVQPMSSNVESPQQHCPRSCSEQLYCGACLSYSDITMEGHASCVWSTVLGECFSSSFYELRCLTGLCGHVIRPPATSCFTTSCSSISYCNNCIRERGCGWLSVEGKNGFGFCREGDFQGPSDATSLADLSASTWNYVRCPAENECLNRHHNCLTPHYNVCVDVLDGFECQCEPGYSLIANRKECKPVCKPECRNGGECILPKKCACAFGFSGNICEHRCDCNGNSDCVITSTGDKCTECLNNTRGDKCQFCQPSFVGDPAHPRRGSGGCVPCLNICHNRTNDCDGDLSFSSSRVRPNTGQSAQNRVPTSIDTTICRNCGGHSQGRLCESCVNGYFELDGVCRKCRCNGHASVCDKKTGVCDCKGDTVTSHQSCKSSGPCWRHQCNKCKDGFEGDPKNGGQCFQKISANQQYCFNPFLKTGCVPDDLSDRTQLSVGQATLFALRPHFSNLDSRLVVDVTIGEVDVYVSGTENLFNVRFDRRSGEQIVTLKRPDFHPYNLVGDDSSSSSRSNKTDDTVFSLLTWTSKLQPKDKVTVTNKTMRTVKASELSNFFVLRPNEALKATAVRNRLVVVCPHLGFEQENGMVFYVIVKARTPSLASSSNDVMSGREVRSIEHAKGEKAAIGSLFFRQDSTKIDLFVFFSTFFSCFFIFLSICLLIWKMKRAFDTQQARIAFQIQLQHMASRPFSCSYVYLPDHLLLPKAFMTSLVVQSSDAFPSPCYDDSTKPFPGRDSLKNFYIAKRMKASSSVRPTSNYCDVLESRTSSRQAFETNSLPRIKPSGPPLRHRQLELVKRGFSGNKTPVQELNVGGSGEIIRPSNDFAEIEEENVPKGHPSNVLEHRVPLLHSTSDYLTVVLNDGNSRLTPENTPPGLFHVGAYHSSPRMLTSPLQMDLDPNAVEQEIRFIETSHIGRSSSAPALKKNASFESSNPIARPKLNIQQGPLLQDVAKRSKREKLKPKLQKPCPFNEGPIAFESTNNLQAGVATVILQLPSSGTMPCSICLGSALVSTKCSSIPTQQDINPSKSRYRFTFPKRLRR